MKNIFVITIATAMILLVAGGWVSNIAKLADMCCGMSGMLVLRVLGIFVAPLGTVLGFV